MFGTNKVNGNSALKDQKALLAKMQGAPDFSNDEDELIRAFFKDFKLGKYDNVLDADAACAKLIERGTQSVSKRRVRLGLRTKRPNKSSHVIEGGVAIMPKINIPAETKPAPTAKDNSKLTELLIAVAQDNKSHAIKLITEMMA